MSRINNPIDEFSVTCGFFNSSNEDRRKYDAKQLSSIFDGIIGDGVYATIGDCFVVNATDSNKVTVGTGRAWFKHTWTLNDSLLSIKCPDSETLKDRIDAIVIEVNHNDETRDNFIKVIKGDASASPIRPTLTRNAKVNQYPLCYIYRKAGSTKITQAEITNVVGTDETPFVTGILQVISLDKLLGQWRSQLDQFVISEKERIQNAMNLAISEIETWEDNIELTINDWFDHMKGQLSSDSATNLQIQIDDSKLEDLLVHGLHNGTKTVSEDGTIIHTVDSNGWTHDKKFSEGFSKCEIILKNNHNITLAKMTKSFSQDGRVISSEIYIL